MVLKKGEGISELVGVALVKYLKECFVYNEISGVFKWNTNRPRSHFRSERAFNIWIARYSGRPAGFRSHEYLIVGINEKLYRVHRLIFVMMTGDWPIGVVDHISGNRSENSWDNLRDVPNYLNACNKKIQRNNSSGFTGVTFDKSRNRYRAFGKISDGSGESKYIFISRHKTFEEACNARVNWQDSQEVFTDRHGK